MKVKSRIVFLGIFITLGFASSWGFTSDSLRYLGKTTWTATINDDTDPSYIGNTFTVTGGITKVGDEFYQFQGYVLIDNDNPMVMTGGGFLNGNNLYFTLTGAQLHTNTWRDTAITYFILDKDSLNGTGFNIGRQFETQGRSFDNSYSFATMTLKGSPINLKPTSTAAMPARNLLLLNKE